MISYLIILFHIMSYYFILSHIISYYLIFSHIISYYIILSHIISYYLILYHIVSYPIFWELPEGTGQLEQLTLHRMLWMGSLFLKGQPRLMANDTLRKARWKGGL